MKYLSREAIPRLHLHTPRGRNTLKKRRNIAPVCSIPASDSQQSAQDDSGQFSVSGQGIVDVVDADEAEVDIFGELNTGNLHFTDKPRAIPSQGGALGLSHAEDVLDMPLAQLTGRVQSLLDRLRVMPSTYPFGDPRRAIFCSRTTNLRSIRVMGFDLDYTIVHYDVDAWEGRAYSYGMAALKDRMGCPIDGLTFQSDLVIRGLILDTELGNVVKADRFGFVKRAMHGTRMMSPAEVRAFYGRELVSLRNESRFVFLNTLFSISEAVMFAQLVDRLDAGGISPEICPPNYGALYKMVAKALFLAHVEGKLKAEIIQDPERFVKPDPGMPQMLMDMRQAGKTLLLITNSDFIYTETVMAHACNGLLPDGMHWRELFDVVIINANKPEFFKSGSASLYEVVTPDGLMRPARSLRRGGLYSGGSARLVETSFGVSGDDIMYVGDHLYSDVQLAKKWESKWRTCLILRELEQEIDALAAGRDHRSRLKDALNKKEQIGDAFNNLRLAKQRNQAGRRGDHPGDRAGPWMDFNEEEVQVNEALGELLAVMDTLDAVIGPAIEADGEEFNRRWGLITRAGVNDQSMLYMQVERYADLYTSRVSNFGRYTPFVYFRSPAQSMTHDRQSADSRLLQRINQSSPRDGNGDSNGQLQGDTRQATERTNSYKHN